MALTVLGGIRRGAAKSAGAGRTQPNRAEGGHEYFCICFARPEVYEEIWDGAFALVYLSTASATSLTVSLLRVM